MNGICFNYVYHEIHKIYLEKKEDSNEQRDIHLYHEIHEIDHIRFVHYIFPL